MQIVFLTGLIIFFTHLQSTGQGVGFIYSKEGKPVLDKKLMILECLNGLSKDRSDPLARKVCECQVDALDRGFTMAQYRKHTRKGIIDITALLTENPSVSQKLNSCMEETGNRFILSNLSSMEGNIRRCMESVSKFSNKKIDSDKLRYFCTCEIETLQSKRLSDAEIKSLEDPNSLLFFEILYRCGESDFSEGAVDIKWTPNNEKDITGPLTDKQVHI